jgi:hypothetical protein
MKGRASACLSGRWPRARITLQTNTWTRRSPSAITAFPPVWHAANSATPQKMYGASSSQPRHSSPDWVAPLDSSKQCVGRRITWEIWSISKVKAGPQTLATIPTSSAVSLVAGLGCLCALSLFLQPKHQAFNIRSKTLFNKKSSS